MSVRHAHEALRERLLAVSGVSDITGTIKPWTLWRSDELPAVTYQQILRDGEWTYDGALDFKRAQYQLSCWSGDFDQSRDLAHEVARALDGYHDEQHGDVYLHSIRVEDVSDMSAEPDAGEEQPPYGVRVDVSVNYERTS